MNHTDGATTVEVVVSIGHAAFFQSIGIRLSFILQIQALIPIEVSNVETLLT